MLNEPKERWCTCGETAIEITIPTALYVRTLWRAPPYAGLVGVAWRTSVFAAHSIAWKTILWFRRFLACFMHFTMYMSTRSFGTPKFDKKKTWRFGRMLPSSSAAAKWLVNDDVFAPALLMYAFNKHRIHPIRLLYAYALKPWTEITLLMESWKCLDSWLPFGFTERAYCVRDVITECMLCESPKAYKSRIQMLYCNQSQSANCSSTVRANGFTNVCSFVDSAKKWI